MPTSVYKNALPCESPVAHKNLIIIFSIYFLMVMSKRLWMPSLQGNLFWLADVACFIAIPGFLLYTSRRFISIFGPAHAGKTDEELPGFGRFIFESVVCFMLVYIFIAIGDRLAIKFVSLYPSFLSKELNYSSHLPKLWLAKFFLVIYYSITAAVIEEFFFRRVFKEILTLQKINSNFIFIAVSSVLFGISHWAGGSSNVISAGMAGIGFAIAYAWTKDIRPVMVAHFVYDFFYYIK